MFRLGTGEPVISTLRGTMLFLLPRDLGDLEDSLNYDVRGREWTEDLIGHDTLQRLAVHWSEL